MANGLKKVDFWAFCNYFCFPTPDLSRSRKTASFFSTSSASTVRLVSLISLLLGISPPGKSVIKTHMNVIK